MRYYILYNNKKKKSTGNDENKNPCLCLHNCVATEKYPITLVGDYIYKLEQKS